MPPPTPPPYAGQWRGVSDQLINALSETGGEKKLNFEAPWRDKSQNNNAAVGRHSFSLQLSQKFNCPFNFV